MDDGATAREQQIVVDRSDRVQVIGKLRRRVVADAVLADDRP
jgi:hypothetical protein